MEEKIIEIQYAPNETGPAQLLGGRLARIVESDLLGKLWEDDIVLLTHRPEGAKSLPGIEKVIWSRYSERSTFTVEGDNDIREAVKYIMPGLLRYLKADCIIPAPGRLCVAHNGIDVAMLADAIGLTFVEDKAEEESPPESAGADRRQG